MCIVTGSSRGIGRAVALALGAQGCKVAVNYAGRQDAGGTWLCTSVILHCLHGCSNGCMCCTGLAAAGSCLWQGCGAS